MSGTLLAAAIIIFCDISASEKVPFSNGTPSCSYDELYEYPRGNADGSLFRLMDNSKKRVCFYNDATDMVVKVRAIMKLNSDVKVLQDARMFTRKAKDGEQMIVEAEVMPRSTVCFIEGASRDFELELGVEIAPTAEQDLNFKQKPQCRYDKAYRCFKDNGNGLFFRLVDSQSNTWYFYNDTHESLMSATVEFDESSVVEPLGDTMKVGVPEGIPGGVIYRISVKPGGTAPFIKGTPEAYRLRYTAEPAEAEKPLRPGEFQYENDGPDERIAGRDAHVFKCFTKKDNGLLFRLVDTARGTWAFYNDTTTTLMQVVLQLSDTERVGVVASPEAQAAPDPTRPDMLLLTMEVPPLATRKMLDGLPKSFEISYVAKHILQPTPAGKVMFRYGGPNPKLMRYDQVFSVWKGDDPEEGELFRLVDTKRKRWGFYNDTKKLILKVEVRFITNEKISPLGATRVEVDRGGDGVSYVVDIHPLSTVKFIQGDYTGFELNLKGITKKSTRRTFVMKH